jgi:hypothetical protein
MKEKKRSFGIKERERKSNPIWKMKRYSRKDVMTVCPYFQLFVYSKGRKGEKKDLQPFDPH